jgi:hypothetical protein
MRESRLSGSVEGVVCKHDSYSDYYQNKPWKLLIQFFHALQGSAPVQVAAKMSSGT